MIAEQPVAAKPMPVVVEATRSGGIDGGAPGAEVLNLMAKQLSPVSSARSGLEGGRTAFWDCGLYSGRSCSCGGRGGCRVRRPPPFVICWMRRRT